MTATPVRGNNMSNKDANIVANTILHQIKCGKDIHGNSGVNMMMCWAFQNPWGETADKKEGRGFLEFTVEGALFTGQVRVTLSWSDTYLLEFSQNEVVVTTRHDIYCEELANVIDRYVENPKNV
jgi:hypothetical protein